ncbi:hypothetical protein N7523_003206 [Penicillium sp. IBT 18751x]|nr:hypothetical protein N7523_003206 [Penicillium sp. IBT 18751x]
MAAVTQENAAAANGGSASTRPGFFKWDSKARRSVKRRPRQPVSCEPCRHSKLKCDRRHPCISCKRRECVEACSYRGISKVTNQPNGALEIERPAPQLSSEPVNPPVQARPLSTTPASRGIGSASLQVTGTPSYAKQQNHDTHAHDTHAQWDALLQRPIHLMWSPNDSTLETGNICFPSPLGPTMSRNEILAILPPAPCCDYLVTEYFLRLSPLFHILHGPTFQKQYNAFRQNPSDAELSWIALFFLMCSATTNTMESDNRILGDIYPMAAATNGLEMIAHQFRTAAMICLWQDQFFIRHTISTLEAVLLLVFTISNNEGAERSWTLLGMALNIGIALRCNTESSSQQLNCVDIERRRRCWAGILLLHTYQATSFQDIDMSALLNINAIMPANVNDIDIKQDRILPPSSTPTQMSVMHFKISLFQLSTKICRHLSGESRANEATLRLLDSEVAEGQRQWDSAFLLDGFPSLLDPAGYAHWCVLQLYAHQLYLLLHRPFCKRGEPYFRSASQSKCIASGAALLDIHRQLCQNLRLRHYRWLVSGLTSFYAIHGAIALASCLLDAPDVSDLSTYRAGFDAAIARIESLQNKSSICAKAYPILRHLQYAFVSSAIPLLDTNHTDIS